MKTANAFVIATMALLVGACAHNKIEMTGDQAKVEKKDVFSMSADWLKEKTGKFDAQVKVSNESKVAQLIWSKDVTCARGEVKGDIKLVGAGHGDVPIPLAAGESKTVIFNCNYKLIEAKGGYTLTVTKVSDNPTGDGRTMGKTVAKDLTLEFVSAKK